MIGREQDEQELLARLDAWDPDREDLPDEVALAMDRSESLRARFDQRFARYEPAPVPVPDQLAERVLDPTLGTVGELGAVGEVTEEVPAASGEVTAEIPRAEALAVLPGRERARVPWRWFVPGLAVAATIPFAILTVGAVGLLAVGYESELSVAPAVGPAVFPGTSTAAPPLGAAQSTDGVASAPRPSAEELRSQLETLGYVDAGTEEDLRPLGKLGYMSPETDPNLRAAPAPREDVPVRPTGDRFDDHGVNTWVETRRQPVSTFSIDVDRGSYSYGRRMLESGYLPDPSSVRVEEYVNALRYDYPAPDDGPFAVQFEASPSPWNDARYVVRIGVQARRPAERPPAHLTFLVDTSGSMSTPDRLPLVKQALRMLAEQLGDGDTLAIVSYAGSAGIVLEPTPATDRRAILAAIDRLYADGATRMGGGIDLAYRQADFMRREGHINRVIIASDGDANVGVTDTAALSKLIEGYADRGITLTTLGFGTGNYQDARMEQLADDGDGNYYYIDGEDEARRVFVDELAGTMEVVARDVKLQVDWNREAVERYRLIGYENRALAARDFRDDRVDAGEIGAGHTVTALYAVELVPGAASPIATVRIRSKPPGGEAPSTERWFNLPRGALQPSFASASRDHRMAVAAAAFADRLRGSPYMTGIGYGEIERIARGAARAEEPTHQELVSLVQRARRLSPTVEDQVLVQLEGTAEYYRELVLLCGDTRLEASVSRGTAVVSVPAGQRCQYLLKGATARPPALRGFVTAGGALRCEGERGEASCVVQAPEQGCVAAAMSDDDGLACSWP